VLAGCKNYSAQSDHAFFADRFADNCKGLLPYFAFGRDEVWAVDIELVDLFFWNEGIDLDRPSALNRDRFEFLGLEL
jgi:hypothetical protein